MLRLTPLRGALLFFVAVCAVYLSTVNPSLGSGDSAEFVTSAATWGIPHSPGYPLYTFLGHLCSRVLPGPLPFRVNALSALLGAAAGAVLLLAALRAGLSGKVALAAASCLCFAPLTWRCCAIADIWALNSLFGALLILLVYGEALGEVRTFAAGLGLVLGLGAAHHLGLLLAGPAVAYYAWKRGRFRGAGRSVWGLLAGAFAVSFFLSYALIWFRLRQNPVYVVGAVRTFAGESSFSLKLVWHELGFYFMTVQRQLTWFGLGLAAFGLLRLFLKDRERAVFLGLWIAATGPLALRLAGYPILAEGDGVYWRGLEAPFCILSLLAWVLALAAGLEGLFSRVRPAFAWGGAALLAAAFLGLRWSGADQRGHDYWYGYGRDVLASSADDGVVFLGSDDALFVMDYLRLLDGGVGDRRFIRGSPEPEAVLASPVPVYMDHSVAMGHGGRKEYAIVTAGVLARAEKDPDRNAFSRQALEPLLNSRNRELTFFKLDASSPEVLLAMLYSQAYRLAALGAVHAGDDELSFQMALRSNAMDPRELFPKYGLVR